MGGDALGHLPLDLLHSVLPDFHSIYLKPHGNRKNIGDWGLKFTTDTEGIELDYDSMLNEPAVQTLLEIVSCLSCSANGVELFVVPDLNLKVPVKWISHIIEFMEESGRKWVVGYNSVM